MLGVLVLAGHCAQGVTREQAIEYAVMRRIALCKVSSVNDPFFKPSAVQTTCETDEAFYRVDFSDDSSISIDRNVLRISFMHSFSDAYRWLRGKKLSSNVITNNVTKVYRAIGYPYGLQWDGIDEDEYGSLKNFGFAHFAPIVNGIPCGREFSVDADVHPVTGAVSGISCRSLPKFDLSMRPALTLEQAKPKLIQFLFNHADVPNAFVTEYDFKLRWGKAPLASELNVCALGPHNDMKALRANDTALLMYDVRFHDPTYSQGKEGAWYRVMMDARNGEMIGIDGPWYSLLTGPGRVLKDAGWDWGPGDIKVYKDSRSVQASGDVATLKNAGGLKPQGVRLLLQRGNLIVKASYDAKRNILWRPTQGGLLAGQPDAKLTKSLQALAQNRRQN